MLAPRIPPQDGDTGLAPHPHRRTLRGEPGALAFPPLCAHCGAAAARRLRYAKVFRRTYSDDPTEYRTVMVEVPFCDACASRHAAQSQPRSWLSDVLASFSTVDMFGAVMLAMAAAFCGWLALKDLLHGDAVRALIMLGIAAFFAALAWFQRRHVWAATHHLRVPPQTEITRAFDFSDDVSGAFEPPRFVCTMRDARFADALMALNAGQLWVAGSPQAQAEKQRADRQMWLVGGVVLVLFLVSLIAEWLRG